MEVAERSLDGDVDDADVLVGFVGFGVNLGIRDPLDRLHAFDAASKHGVLVVQPGLQTQTGEAFRSPAKRFLLILMYKELNGIVLENFVEIKPEYTGMEIDP